MRTVVLNFKTFRLGKKWIIGSYTEKNVKKIVINFKYNSSKKSKYLNIYTFYCWG